MAGPQIPTTKELTEQNIANYEAAVGQTVPLNKQALMRQLAAAQATSHTGLYKFGWDRQKENLAISASIDGLTDIGSDHGVIQKPAQSAVFNIRGQAAPSTVIPATNAFIGDANGERYTPDAEGVEAGGYIDMTVTADDTGTEGNLNVGENMTLENQVAGAGRSFDIIEIVQLGTNKEETETYRQRVLFEIRTQGGGGNAADYKRWGELVAGVKRCYPYSGRPIGAGIAKPVERSVFVEVETFLQSDGIPTQTILDAVRESITRDAEDGKTNQPLGLTDGTLYVPAIFRTAFFVEIRGIDVEASKEFAAKQDIETEVDRYFRSLYPFVDSVDPPSAQNNIITSLTVSTTVQSVLSSYGGSAAFIGVGIAPSTFFSTYTLNQGQTAKNGGITYA